MSAYFATFRQEVTDLAVGLGPLEFLEALAFLEDCRLEPIRKIVFDREFPVDVAREIQHAMNYYGIRLSGRCTTHPSAKNYALTLKESPLFERLGQIFEELADTVVITRFGCWTDDPVADLRCLEAAGDA